MTPILVFDTETSGLPLFEEPSEHQDQPHIVQLAALLIDPDTRKEVGALDVVVRPDGWTIPAEVAAIHGITQEMAMDVGIPEATAVDMLMAMWDGGLRLRVAHNESFDARILRIALKRHIDPRGGRFVDGTEVFVSDTWKAGSAVCTQRLATPILKLPPTAKMRAAKRFHHKSANLGEAYEHFTGQPLEGAHNAMVDVRACATVFFAIKALQQAEEPVPA